MRRDRMALWTLSCLCLLAGCPPEPAARNVCEQAVRLVEGCGVSVPLLDPMPCTGVAKLIGGCIVQLAHDCDSLARVRARIAECQAGLLDLPPLDPLPLPDRDGAMPDSSPPSQDLLHDAAADASLL